MSKSKPEARPLGTLERLDLAIELRRSDLDLPGAEAAFWHYLRALRKALI